MKETVLVFSAWEMCSVCQCAKFHDYCMFLVVVCGELEEKPWRRKRKLYLIKRGRPSKLTDRAKRHILRCFSKIRESEGTFCVKRLMQQSGISERDVTPRTINRFLNDNGYRYLQARKKGLITRKDLKDRVAFATAVLHERPTNFWTDQVAFYCDGTGIKQSKVCFSRLAANMPIIVQNNVMWVICHFLIFSPFYCFLTYMYSFFCK